MLRAVLLLRPGRLLQMQKAALSLPPVLLLRLLLLQRLRKLHSQVTPVTTASMVGFAEVAARV